MHLLLAKDGLIDDGSEPIDLGQSPAEVVIYSAADTEIAALAMAFQGRGERAFTLRIANITALQHPFSVDLHIEKTAARANLIIVRALGGAGYWPYGLDRLIETARGNGAIMVTVPGDDRVDPALSAYSTVSPDRADRVWRYLKEGGAPNLTALFDLIDGMLGRAGREPAPPMPLGKCGIYWPGLTDPDLSTVLKAQPKERPLAALVFYRALMQDASLGPVDALIEGLDAEGVNALPLYVSSLKDRACAVFIEETFAAHSPDVVLNATAFAVSKAGVEHAPTPLDAFQAPVFQTVFSRSTEEAWRESGRGLSSRDLAMHVVMPEVDGRILTRAVSFKKDMGFDDLTEARIVTHQPLQDRVSFVAQLAANWARLRRAKAQDRRVALILANYPNKDGRIANGVGLDTPASAVTVLQALQAAGYTVEDLPGDAKALIERLLAGPTNAAVRDGGATLSLADYLSHHNALPEPVQTQIQARWGAADRDPFVRDGQFHFPIQIFGNAAVMIQPARGYNIDPKDSYHDPDLVPPHGYLAAYIWLRAVFGVHALVHLGKHGNLEWLPGKALALSEDCFPEAAMGPVPHLYPFIVNDPGEGAQAKRRTSAVIIDHLTPPLTRAESHGAGAHLETLLDEYVLAEGLDPRRAEHLLRDILDHVQSHGFDRDIGLNLDGPEADVIATLDNHLCDLKELQIRDGLHVLGESPEGQLRADLTTAVARVPRSGESAAARSLHRAIAEDLGLEDFDPLDCDFGAPWDGDKPVVLASLSNDPWRIAGDTVERIELLAHALVAVEMPCLEEWTATRAVLDWIDGTLKPRIDACGHDEIAALLNGLDGGFVRPGPSGAPSRGRPDVLPTGRNFYAVDVRAVPTKAAYALGSLSAERLVERYVQDHGEWPKAMALSAWGTSNMRTGGDDIAQALALIGARPLWEEASGRVTGFQVVPLSELQRPRVDVTLRISGFFRDAFPQLIDLFDSAVRAISELEEPSAQNPLAANVEKTIQSLGEAGDHARRLATYRVFGSMPGAYGAGLQALIDEGIWEERSDLAEAFLVWGGYAYGAGSEGKAARPLLEERLTSADAVIHNQDNREHDLLDSDDYYQFEGGLAATVEHLRGEAPAIYHNDHSRPERPVIRSLNEEIGRVVRGRAANPKWIAGVMRHGYKGAFEMAATVDYLFAFAASTNAVSGHHFDQLFDAYLEDDAVSAFIAEENPAALKEMAARFEEAIARGLWSPRRNSVYDRLDGLK